MAQVSLYIDDSLLREVEIRAKAEKLSLSAWVRLRLEESLRAGWPPSFQATFGALAEIEGFERPAQIPFERDSVREPFGE